jgi:hypothetical protein
MKACRISHHQRRTQRAFIPLRASLRSLLHRHKLNYDDLYSGTGVGYVFIRVAIRGRILAGLSGVGYNRYANRRGHAG